MRPDHCRESPDVGDRDLTPCSRAQVRPDRRRPQHERQDVGGTGSIAPLTALQEVGPRIVERTYPTAELVEELHQVQPLESP